MLHSIPLTLPTLQIVAIRTLKSPFCFELLAEDGLSNALVVRCSAHSLNQLTRSHFNDQNRLEFLTKAYSTSLHIGHWSMFKMEAYSLPPIPFESRNTSEGLRYFPALDDTVEENFDKKLGS